MSEIKTLTINGKSYVIYTPEKGVDYYTDEEKLQLMAQVIERITPESIGARPDTWLPTAEEIGAAPNNYGFGGKPVSISSSRIYTEDELDTALEAVYSSMDTYNTKLVRILGYPSASDFNWFGILSRSSEKYGSLLAHSANSKGSLVLKTKYNGVWLPTEWVNPPMLSGTEYRTTERWNNKPVYTKTVSLGTLPNATTKKVAHAISLSNVVRVCGTSGTGKTIPYYSGTSMGTISADKTNINVYYNFDASTTTGYAQIWYTKDE